MDLRGRRCVVVGGGAVGLRKALALAECGAEVVVVDPALSPEARSADGSGGLTVIAAAFSPEHLEGAFVAVAATDRPDVNAAVAEAARESGVLLNLASPTSVGGEDEAEGGDFVTMAALRRGELLIGVTTGGAGPALAARLKRELDERFGPEWGDFARLLGDARRTAKTHIPDGKRRAAALRELAGRDDLRALLAAGDCEAAEREVAACLS